MQSALQNVMSEDQEPLTTAEEKRKEELVKVVKDGLNKFIEVGMALVELRDKKLYRNTHETFEKFVNDTFSIGIRYAQMLMKGTKTVENLKTRTQVRLPESERQVRPLSGFGNDPALQAKLWGKVIQRADGGSPSPACVREVVEEYYKEECGVEDDIDEDEYLTEPPAGSQDGVVMCEEDSITETIDQGKDTAALARIKYLFEELTSLERGVFVKWLNAEIKKGKIYLT